MKAMRGPYPYTPWTYHIQIAISINLHAVWYTVLLATWLGTEDPSVAQSTVRVEVVYVDISLGGIITYNLVPSGENASPFGSSRSFVSS